VPSSSRFMVLFGGCARLKDTAKDKSLSQIQVCRMHGSQLLQRGCGITVSYLLSENRFSCGTVETN
jgi:hypothetical protein